TLIFQAFSAIRSLISWYLATLGQIYPISAQLMWRYVTFVYTIPALLNFHFLYVLKCNDFFMCSEARFPWYFSI
ncbi:hypothetical protein, partial [Candidatus Jettenia sp. AMX1]|uniref:hypothetical protein n=1 Tax=Candidatus Jettenia sp. AMX1 TaxID=2293637 RepID=UPI002555EA74